MFVVAIVDPLLKAQPQHLQLVLACLTYDSNDMVHQGFLLTWDLRYWSAGSLMFPAFRAYQDAK